MEPTPQHDAELIEQEEDSLSQQRYTLEDVLSAETVQCLTPLEGIIDQLNIDENELKVSFIFQGQRYQSIPAKTHISLNDDDNKKACTLLFLGGDLSKPVVAGLLMDLFESRDQKIIESDHSIILRAGKAEIVLEDDSIEIRGEFVSTEALSVNKISGGSVKIN